jgi:hypothetical protein
VLTIVGAAVAFLRMPPGARNVLWAEDGAEFVTAALAHRPLGSFFEPYAGYMHAFPRVAALVATWIAPLDYVPVVVTAIACGLTGFTGALVFVLLRSRMPAVLPRLAVWVCIVALPVAGLEANGSIANSHWYLLIALFAVMLTRQKGAALIAIASVTVAFAVLSDPMAVVFLPIALLRVFGAKDKRSLWVPLVYFGSLVIQLIVAASTTTLGAATVRPVAGQLARSIGFRVFLSALGGESGSVWLYTTLGVVSLIVATLIVVALVIVVVVSQDQLGGLAVMSVVAAVLLFSVDIYIRWLGQFDPAVSVAWGSSRYSVTPTALITIALACAAALAESRWKRVGPARFAPAIVLLALVTAIAIPAFTVTYRYPASPWSTQLSIARAACQKDPGENIMIPTVPSGPHWAVSVACGELIKH